MSTRAFTLFDTPIGACALAWGEDGIVGVQLPEASPAVARKRLLRRFPDAAEAVPPPGIRRAIDAILALLSGGAPDLSAIPLDMKGLPAFNRRVYEIARAIPPGRTRSYGDIAVELGDPAAARDVGQALGRNPFPIVVPCHRVLAAGGKLGGFSARGGVATKLKMLAIEGALRGETPGLFADLPLMARPRGRG